MNTKVRFELGRVVRIQALSFLLVLIAASCADGPAGPGERAPGESADAAPAPAPAPAETVDDSKADQGLSLRPVVEPLPGTLWPTGIKQVVLSAREVCPGESISVDIEPLGEGYDYAIDGMETESRTLQLGGAPGARIILVEAWPRGKRELVRVQQLRVTVREGCATAQDLTKPVIKTSPSWHDPLEVHLTVANARALSADSYEWSFGDGTSVITSVPAVDHVYGPGVLSFQRPQTIFDVSVVARSARGSATGHKSIAVHTPYAREKARGVLQPPVIERARFSARGPSVVAAVYNPERHELLLTSVDVRYQPCDATLDPRPLSSEPLLVALPAESRYELQVGLPNPPDDACGVELYARGTARASESGRAYDVEIPLYAEVRRSPARTREVSAATAERLEELFEQGLLPADGVVTDDQLRLLERSGLFEWQEPETVRTYRAQTGTVPDGEEELECAPGTVEAAPHPGWVCKATSTWVRDEPYIANGHAGDIVLSAGCGEIGTMLRALTNPQTYSHTGIMVQHYDAIRHSTAIIKRFEDNRAGKVGAQGVVPEVLRFAQPGAITATVEGAYHGMTWRDPKSGKNYRVAGFGQDATFCAGDDALVYPLVITGRPASYGDRRRIAEEALKLRAHYRFFAYSEAKIAGDRRYDMPSELGLPVMGTQCSSFVWSAARAAGITLEGELEESDVELGAKTQRGILDGLYFYAAAERRAAAARLYSTIYNQVNADGGLKGRIADAPDNWGNQIANCFASDACELKDRDSTAWKKTATTGRTVSPQDLLFWDEPYGRSEPLAYRVGTFRKVHVWQAPNGAGKLEVTVRDAQGGAVAAATVTIGDFARSTNSAGMVTVSPDAGSLHVSATKRIGGLVHTGQATAKVVKGETTKLTITLSPPPATMRAIRISGVLRVVDDELFGGDEKGTLEIEQDVMLNPARKSRTLSFEKCAGGEVRAEVELKLTLNGDNSVSMTGRLLLYEGAKCDTGDREDTKSGSLTIPVGMKSTFGLKAKNSGAGGGDTASLSLTLSNNQAK